MKRIRHTVFTKLVRQPLWAWKEDPQREKHRERIRQQAEDFINEIGPANVVTLVEHEPRFGPFSVVVWWLEALPEGPALVIRAADEHDA
jgi:cell division inhibitor SulA